MLTDTCKLMQVEQLLDKSLGKIWLRGSRCRTCLENKVVWPESRPKDAKKTENKRDICKESKKGKIHQN